MKLVIIILIVAAAVSFSHAQMEPGKKKSMYQGSSLHNNDGICKLILNEVKFYGSPVKDLNFRHFDRWRTDNRILNSQLCRGVPARPHLLRGRHARGQE